ncbi:unnamed protein product [Rhodiola kirilowii]
MKLLRIDVCIKYCSWSYTLRRGCNTAAKGCGAVPTRLQSGSDTISTRLQRVRFDLAHGYDAARLNEYNLELKKMSKMTASVMDVGKTDRGNLFRSRYIIGEKGRQK